MSTESRDRAELGAWLQALNVRVKGHIANRTLTKAVPKGTMQQDLTDYATECGDEAMKLQPQDVVRRIAEMWKAEPEEIRKGWNDDAKAKKAESEASASSAEE